MRHFLCRICGDQHLILEKCMQELNVAEINDVSGGKSIFYWFGFGLGAMAANVGSVDMLGAMACGA